jgi:hypothetical protein
VVVLINKAAAPVTAGVRIAAPRAYTTADRWVLDGDGATIDAAAAVAPVAQNAFSVELPASSVTILVPR